MLDIITNPIGDVFNLIGNIFQFFAVVIVLFVVGIVVAIPLGMKLFAVSLAKTLVVETAKVIEVASNNAQIKNAVTQIATQLTNTSNQLKKGQD